MLALLYFNKAYSQSSKKFPNSKTSKNNENRYKVKQKNMGPGCERLVRFVILVAEFSRAWRILCISIVYLGLSTAVGTVGRIGRYCYR